MQEIPIRKVDTQAFLGAVSEMVKEGNEIPIIITGNSMSPFLIHERDRILLARIEQPLKKGDMVLYRRLSGQYVMHRIRRVKTDKSGEKWYDLIGDAQSVTESPIREGQMIAVVTKVCRKGKWIEPGDFVWEFFRHIWLHMIPVRQPLVRFYTACKRK